MSKADWPQQDVDLRLLTGATEVGTDLFVLGSFGGFGGNLFTGTVCRDLEEAKKLAYRMNKDMSFHVSIYRISVKLEDEFIEEAIQAKTEKKAEE